AAPRLATPHRPASPRRRCCVHGNRRPGRAVDLGCDAAWLAFDSIRQPAPVAAGPAPHGRQGPAAGGACATAMVGRACLRTLRGNTDTRMRASPTPRLATPGCWFGCDRGILVRCRFLLPLPLSPPPMLP